MTGSQSMIRDQHSALSILLVMASLLVVLLGWTACAMLLLCCVHSAAGNTVDRT